MNKTKFKYVKYTKLELDRYVRDEKSCIKRINSELHVGFPPWGFANFEETLTNIISRDKIGKYDAKLDGIILEVRNIKVLGSVYPVHDDDPYNHINIRANFYVFQPQIGSIVEGVIKHISHGHVAVIIYRVFNVSIRFDRSEMQHSLHINQKISFRMKKFELQGAMPYIAGELVDIDTSESKNLNKHLKFENDDENDANNGGDSGISTEETHGNHIKKAESSETDSSSSSESDSDSDEHSNEDLVNELLPNIRIKQEKLSDTEENTKLMGLSGLENIKSERDENSSDESDSSDSDESKSNNRQEETSSSSDSEIDIKQEKQSNDSSSSSSSSSSSNGENVVDQPLKEIKKEKDANETTTTSATYIPRPIKAEPQSDTEGTSSSKFKTPASNHRFNTSHTSTKSHKKNKNQSIDDDVSTFTSPIMSSTLKIKQEPVSEDESGKQKRRKTTQNNQSFESIENDLYASFLK